MMLPADKISVVSSNHRKRGYPSNDDGHGRSNSIVAKRRTVRKYAKLGHNLDEANGE